MTSDDAVIVIGTSSKRDDIDPALRRPGRFDKEIELGVPSVLQRSQVGITQTLYTNYWHW